MPSRENGAVTRNDTPIVVLGAGGHAKVVIEILEAVGGWKIEGLISDKADPTRTVAGYHIIGGDADWARIIDSGITHAAMGLGGWTDNQARWDLFERAAAAGFQLVSAVHPSAIVSPSVRIGEGSMVSPGAILHAEVEIGRNTIILPGSTIDHETVIGDHVLVATGVTVGAQVEIGNGAFLAISSAVTSRTRIGAGALVAAGAVVIADVEAATTVFGIPAKPRDPGAAVSADPAD